MESNIPIEFTEIKMNDTTLPYVSGGRTEYPLVKLQVAIVGAGIGGLSSAIALKTAGFDVTVYEAAPALAEVRHDSSSDTTCYD